MRISHCFLLIAFLFCTACAHYPENARLARFDPHAGYRFENFPPTAQNSDEIFVVLAFSGGGARAAAFSYGILEELRKTPIASARPASPAAGSMNPAVSGPADRCLLDEVDVITSVSASSFTAAYYALHHEKTFDEFPRACLYRDLEAQLYAAAANPVNWLRLPSPTFDRNDLAAEEYDNAIYHGATYGDLVKAGRRPYLLISAVDYSLARRFEFTQEQFDFLYSDLASVPLARAVAASSAFPVFLNPITLDNHPRGSDFSEPAWMDAALAAPQSQPRLARRAADLRSYENAVERPRIRLIDGALADYTALRIPLESLQTTGGDFSLRRLINAGRIKKLVIISINAVCAPTTDSDKNVFAPSWYDVLWRTAETPIRNASFDLTLEFQERLQADQVLVAQQQLGDSIAQVPTSARSFPEYKSYFVPIDFSSVPDAALRQRLEAMATSLSLTSDKIDDLRRAASLALRNSPTFQNLLKDLK